MIEGEDEQQMRHHAEAIANAIRQRTRRIRGLCQPSPTQTWKPLNPASRSPGPPATTPSSAPASNSSQNSSWKPSTSAAPGTSWMLPPATATPLSRPPRRGCRVTSTDFVPALLDRGRNRAAAEGFRIDFQIADAEALPFETDRFDAAFSTVGVMFTPNQPRAAAELFRVTKPGGRIGPRQLDSGQLRWPHLPRTGQVSATPRRCTAAVALGYGGASPHASSRPPQRSRSHPAPSSSDQTLPQSGLRPSVPTTVL